LFCESHAKREEKGMRRRVSVLVMVLVFVVIINLFSACSWPFPTLEKPYVGATIPERTIIDSSAIEILEESEPTLHLANADYQYTKEKTKPRKVYEISREIPSIPEDVGSYSKIDRGQSILEWNLRIVDNTTYDYVPMYWVTPLTVNGTVRWLEGVNGSDPSYNWQMRYTGANFPPLTEREAIELLSTEFNYVPCIGEGRLVYACWQLYWAFPVKSLNGAIIDDIFVRISMGENANDQNSSLAVKNIVLTKDDMIAKLATLNSFTSWGAVPPSSHTSMVGQVPYFLQGNTPWCAVFSLKEIFWYWGREDVSEFDIANHFGGAPNGLYPYQVEEAFSHWGFQFHWHGDGKSIWDSGTSYTTDDIKADISVGWPTIIGVRHDLSVNHADHAVTVVGYNESHVCILDTGAHLGFPGYDIWLSYNTLEQHWNVPSSDRYYSIPHTHTHCICVGYPGDQEYVHSTVALNGLPSEVDLGQTYELQLALTEDGSDAGSSRYFWAQGVFLNLYGAELVSASSGGFNSYQAYDESGNSVPISGAKIIEFYSEFTLRSATIYAYATVKVTSNVIAKYRGWITDEDDMTHCSVHIHAIDDARPDPLTMNNAELVIDRKPNDIQNDRSNFLDYPTFEEQATLKGLAPSTISVSVSPSQINLGGGTTISGTISSSTPGDMSGTVFLQYSTDNVNWYDIDATASSSSGVYSYWWTPSSIGTFYVRSYWNGNNNYGGATSSSVTLTVIPATTGEVELYYDDGGADYGYSYQNPYGFAVFFASPSTAWRLSKIKVSGWYAYSDATFFIEVWDIDRNELFQSSYRYSDCFQQYLTWTEIDISDIIVTSDFYIAIFPNYVANAQELWIGGDVDAPIAGRSYHVNMDTNYVYTPSLSDRDYMIRALGSTLLEDHTMCKGVQPNDPWDPITRTNTFYTNDYAAYSWLKFVYIYSPSHTVTWEWYDPDDVFIDDASSTIPDPASEGREYWPWCKASCYLPIDGYQAWYASRLGRPFKVKVYYDGTLILIQTWQVIKHGSSITCSLSSTTITYEQSATVSSQLSPSFSDGTTTLQYSIDGVSWNDIDSGTPSGGYYSCSWTPPNAGGYYLRAVWSGNDNYYGSTSSVQGLTVERATTSLATTLSASSIFYGDSVTITATLSPPLNGKIVTIQFSLDGSSWYYLNSGTTNSAGEYSFEWSPGLGEYYLRSSWTGDQNYQGSTSPSETLTVSPGPIRIKADGRITPPTAPISSLDNVTYTFTGNIMCSTDGIVVERSNIVVDGNGYTLQGSGSGYGFTSPNYETTNVTIQNTNIKGFGTGVWRMYGCTLLRNNITDNSEYGVVGEGVSGLISQNIIANNGYEGIDLHDGTSAIISGNTFRNDGIDSRGYGSIFGNNIDGGIILVREGASMSVLGNNVSNGGICIWEQRGDTISGNNITNSNTGISLWGAMNCIISRNSITNCDCGISFGSYTGSNTISENNITNCGVGIRLGGDACSSNTVTGNIVANNSYGILLMTGLSAPWHTRIYHNNFIYNAEQAGYEGEPPQGSVDFWDDGYPSGGNYWSDYSGADLCWGPYQNKTGSDGIGDTPYAINGNNRDSYPLMSPYEYWTNPILGDINRDMKVDTRDLVQLATAYGTTSDESDWNPNCDINRDNKIDVIDLFDQSKNYGETTQIAGINAAYNLPLASFAPTPAVLSMLSICFNRKKCPQKKRSSQKHD